MGVIDNLISEELEKANSFNTAFNTDHETYGVIKEEVEETIEEMEKIKQNLNDFWMLVRVKENESNKKSLKNEKCRLLKNIYQAVLCLINEAIQVGAMVEKGLNSMGHSHIDSFGRELFRTYDFERKTVVESTVLDFAKRKK